MSVLRLILAFATLSLGIVLSPLRAAAATVPVLIAYDAAVGRGIAAKYGYDEAPNAYGGTANLRATPRAGAVPAYDDLLEHPHPGEVRSEGTIYDALYSTTAAEGGKDIALGLSSTLNHSEGLLARFASNIGAVTHEGWVAGGLAEAGPFEARFLQAAENAGGIKFNLSGINGIGGGVPNVALSGLRVTSGEVTMAELAHILRTPSLLGKTQFFLNGAEAAAPALLP